MRIKVINLRAILKEKRMGIAELVRRMNELQEKVAPEKRKATRNAVYGYFDDAAPSPTKAYLLAAILNIPPHKLYEIVFDEKAYKDCKAIAKNIFP